MIVLYSLPEILACSQYKFPPGLDLAMVDVKPLSHEIEASMKVLCVFQAIRALVKSGSWICNCKMGGIKYKMNLIWR
jgi:hypothetical protein